MKKFIVSAITVNFLFTAMFAKAEEHVHDHGDNPVVTKAMFDQLELHNEDGATPFVVDAQVWIGNDLNKLWLKADVEKRDGKIEEAEVQALYSRAITPYWDLQMGLRQDVKPSPTRTWGALGVHGLSPYFFEVDAAVFVGESGKTALRFTAEYELLFTQQLILSPDIEVNFHGQDDWETGAGSGLSDFTAGLRLRYEIKRELAPYIGVEWHKKMGDTANLAELKGETSSDTSLVAGVRIWF